VSPQDVTTPPPSALPSPATLRRLAVREALAYDQPDRPPGTAGRRDRAWVEHRYRELLERYGVTEEEEG
jgi:hypothetical protein